MPVRSQFDWLLQLENCETGVEFGGPPSGQWQKSWNDSTMRAFVTKIALHRIPVLAQLALGA
jgi:hypothetical protein